MQSLMMYSLIHKLKCTLRLSKETDLFTTLAHSDVCLLCWPYFMPYVGFFFLFLQQFESKD